MFQYRMKKILSCLGILFVLGACSTEGEFAAEVTDNDIQQDGELRGQAPTTLTEDPETGPEASEAPIGFPTPAPTPPVTPAATPVATPPNNPPANQTPPAGPVGGLHPELGPLSARQDGILPADLVVTRATTQTILQSVDVTLPLQKIYAVAPLEYTAPDGQQVSFDPLARIQPAEGSGTIHFVRPSPLLAQQPSYLEVGFRVNFPSRFAYNRATGYWGNFFPTDWLRFKLLACSVDNRCRVLEEDIAGQTTPGSCQSPEGGCERHYYVRQNTTTFADHYVVLVEGTEAADYQDENGYGRLCSNSTEDCFYSHPFCVAGLCAAVSRGGNYYQVMSPEALLSGN